MRLGYCQDLSPLCKLSKKHVYQEQVFLCKIHKDIIKPLHVARGGIVYLLSETTIR